MARLAAAHLNIPFYSWNFISEYKRRVADYMLEGYRRGVTPNPDMMCNREIKFGMFFEKAMALGADFVATGHYARIAREGGNVFLHEGADPEKDQSYFLAMVDPDRFSRVLFPVGKYHKTQVREMARRLRLPNADRKDSQGICFIGEMDVTSFLKERLQGKRGPIVDTEGNRIGEHGGIYWYTVGQRRGISLPGGPYYVVRHDIPSNTLVVTKNEKDISSYEALVRSVNWMAPQEDAFQALARIRYRGPKVPVSVQMKGDECRLVFKEAQRAVTPGQFAVLYEGSRMLAGGVIERM